MTMRSAVLRGDTASLSVIRPEVLPIDGEALVSEHARAQREGRSAGYAAGLAQARAEAQEAAETAAAAQASALGALEAAIAQARSILETERQGLERAAAELAFKITEAMVGRELKLSSSPGLEAVRRALAESPESDGAVVRLNPADAEALGDSPELNSMTIVPDPSIGVGGCVLEVGAAFVDARIEASLALVREVLNEAAGKP